MCNAHTTALLKDNVATLVTFTRITLALNLSLKTHTTQVLNIMAMHDLHLVYSKNLHLDKFIYAIVFCGTTFCGVTSMSQ